MQKELASCGDQAEIKLHANAAGTESVGIEGAYHVVCRDAEGNVKWEEGFPNLVNAVGKQLMLSVVQQFVVLQHLALLLQRVQLQQTLLLQQLLQLHTLLLVQAVLLVVVS